MSRSRLAAGTSLARHICKEIGRKGLSHLLTAKYIPERDSLRVGVPTEHGSLDCCIDYPSNLQSVQRVKLLIDHYAASHQTSAPARRAA
jgi:hypothetical protein